MSSWLTSIYQDISITWQDNINFFTLNFNGTSYYLRFTFAHFINLLSFTYCVLLTYYIIRFVYKLIRRKEAL